MEVEDKKNEKKSRKKKAFRVKESIKVSFRTISLLFNYIICPFMKHAIPTWIIGIQFQIL